MRTICISPVAQKAALLGVTGAMAAAVAAQWPELQRYLKIRQM